MFFHTVEFAAGSQPYYIKTNTGRLSDTDKVFLRLGIEGDAESLQVSVNDTVVEFVGTEECGYPVHTQNKIYEYLVPKCAYAPCGQVVEFIYRSDSTLRIDYADIVVLP